MFHLLIYNHVVLHPEKKMSHFKKYWSKPLQADVLELLEAKVCSSHIFTIFLLSDVSHSLLRGTIISTPSPPYILVPHPLKKNPASMVCFSTSVRKSGPVRSFTPWVMDRDWDRSTKVLIPQKTGPDRSRPLFSGLEPVWTSLGSSSILTGSRPVFRPDKLKIGHVSINSIC